MTRKNWKMKRPSNQTKQLYHVISGLKNTNLASQLPYNILLLTMTLSYLKALQHILLTYTYCA